MSTEDKEKKPVGRPRILITEEDKKEYRQKYNAMRGKRKTIYKTCDICNKIICSQNLNLHNKTRNHLNLLEIKKLNSQLEKEVDNIIS